MRQLGGHVNLVICQKSKIDDWFEHFVYNYDDCIVCMLDRHLNVFLYECETGETSPIIGIINYDLIFRRPELLTLHYDTVMLDESSMIQNDSAKRTKAILKLKTDNVILLSGSPTGGKYERLYSQLKLLGYPETKTRYFNDYIITKKIDMGGFRIPIVTGYKNIGKLKRTMRRLGCNFLKTDEVFDLPKQTFTDIKTDTTKEYRKFKKSHIVTVGDNELIGDTVLTQMLYERQLCGAYNAEKLAAFADILQSTNDRLIVFYNFNNELDALKRICRQYDKPTAEVNGHTKDLDAYETANNSVTLVQYQSGAKGLNLQLANKLIYFSPTLSVEDYMQSIKRIHRIGQSKPCFYYRLICKRSVENRIYDALERGVDFTEQLFKKG